ncbi:deoxyribose-phosphate aldolase [Desulfopila aestuarii]|uniref:Deoxyribose-phosphate aldolase n=1 Tax=Desulfopila aestuarii DSM 18488 TaxID=1121416 RepID=A0A1M7YIM6_9BACT|nr:deoxyribose-phosphate aldolase [Desulfopila aestuarii]SHO52368.1 deoxyribose-phosphate aldolase [Desulfopila aestuarii DSM 18488]
MQATQLAGYFDHTLLKPAVSSEEVQKLCEEAIEYGFYSVCVNPIHVQLVKSMLTATPVKVCSVVGFPLGANTSEIKAQETARAVADGADEIDMVINVGALKEGGFGQVVHDIEGVVAAAGGRVVKVIIETCLLTEEDKVTACKLAQAAGAHFVKTSTGFAGGGATEEDVALIRRTVGESMQVKASGGIKTLNDAKRMIAAGADRLGASAGVSILKELLSVTGS